MFKTAKKHMYTTTINNARICSQGWAESQGNTPTYGDAFPKNAYLNTNEDLCIHIQHCTVCSHRTRILTKTGELIRTKQLHALGTGMCAYVCTNICAQKALQRLIRILISVSPWHQLPEDIILKKRPNDMKFQQFSKILATQYGTMAKSNIVL